MQVPGNAYQYFGARYYNSDISVWLSVDPLADKYPMISSYAYVYNNPINLIDRWGLEGEKPEKFGLGKRFINWVIGNGYKNKANKFAVKNNITDIEVDENDNIVVQEVTTFYNRETNYNGIIATDYVFTKEKILVEVRNSTIPKTFFYSIDYKNFKGILILGKGPGRNGYIVGQEGRYFESIDFEKFMENFKPDPFIFGSDKQEYVPRIWAGPSNKIKDTESGKYYKKGDTMGYLPAKVKDSVKHYKQSFNGAPTAVGKKTTN